MAVRGTRIDISSRRSSSGKSTRFPLLKKTLDVVDERPLRGVSNDDHETDDIVMITVIDTAHKATKTYPCKRELLLTSMRYFQSILGNHGQPQVDLSIHCDISIFEWLLNYIHNPTSNPLLNAQDVLSILISSEFLKMNSLVESCLQFIVGHLFEILQLPIDVTCINDGLMDRISENTSPSHLNSIKLKRNKFLSRIYKHKLKQELSISKSPTALSVCMHCGCPYLHRFATHLLCAHPQALAVVNPSGLIARRHSPIRNLSLLHYLKVLRGLNLGWEEIYWICWASRVMIVHPSSSSKESSSVMLSAMQTQYYVLHKDGVFIHRRFLLAIVFNLNSLNGKLEYKYLVVLQTALS